MDCLRKGGIVCFGGEDWWYHNRAHLGMPLTAELWLELALRDGVTRG